MQGLACLCGKKNKHNPIFYTDIVNAISKLDLCLVRKPLTLHEALLISLTPITALIVRDTLTVFQTALASVLMLQAYCRDNPDVSAILRPLRSHADPLILQCFAPRVDLSDATQVYQQVAANYPVGETDAAVIAYLCELYKEDIC